MKIDLPSPDLAVQNIQAALNEIRATRQGHMALDLSVTVIKNCLKELELLKKVEKKEGE